MKIGIIGTGHIGKTLVLVLSAAGHEVKVANSRGAASIGAGMLAKGARAVDAAEAVVDVDVLILSIPLSRIADVAPLVTTLPSDAVVIDTSNYYPARDAGLDVIDAGQVESEWVVEQLGRPVAKAWNAIGSDSFANKGRPACHPERLAIPVSADDDASRVVSMALVEDSGFDAVYAGKLAQSWRQQPGAPCYCTDLTRQEMAAALASAQKERLAKRRDMSYEAVAERMTGTGARDPSAEFLVGLNRMLFM